MAASFEEAKGKFNLLFEKDEYVEDVANLESGPFSEKVLAKYDIRTEGDLKVGDEMPTVSVYNAKKERVSLTTYSNEGRPLVLTFGSFS